MRVMLRTIMLFLSVLMLGFGSNAAAGIANPDSSHPVIKDFGRIQPLPAAINQPSPETTHKAVFDITKPAADASQPNPGLDRVARAVNLFASAGVPRDKRDFVAVIHGPATPSVLNVAQYQAQFGRENPNTKLIKALRDADVAVHVCGQALAKHGFDQDWVDPNVDVALSALSDLIIYGNRGYALVPQ